MLALSLLLFALKASVDADVPVSLHRYVHQSQKLWIPVGDQSLLSFCRTLQRF